MLGPPGAFRQRIRAAIANPALQVALDANAKRRAAGRAAALASLPDWESRRTRARQVRADVIRHLDTHLEEFVGNVERNGVKVHRARNAEEAVSLVCDLVGRTGSSPLVAKSKSMVSEEIGLNGALESAGIRVVETDLGEYIVQLRGEKPSHIITPAVHLRRHEVGALFHKVLGIPYTEDVATLTAAARGILREVFLTADVGISGVNFGVAETGALCVVSNEGNARMVTTLPRVHIALMGMERLVPTLSDLALMLSLLARAATGQKLSVYTQLLCTPAPDQVRHLIILDGGRARLRNSPLAEALHCIRCGACLNACPVFREIGGHAYQSVYPGPIGSVISAGILGSDFELLAQASSLCGACRDACPVEIDLPGLLIRVRAGQSPGPEGRVRMGQSSASSAGGGTLSSRARLSLKLYGFIASRPRLFAAAQRLAGLASQLAPTKDGWLRPPAWTGWGESRDFPAFASRPYQARFGPAKGQAGTGRRGRHDSSSSMSGSGVSPPWYEPTEEFIREVRAVGGNVIETTGAAISEEILTLLGARNITHVHLEPGLLDEAPLREHGIRVTREPDPDVQVGITGCICAFADTGSIVLVDGRGSPLQASLLPEIHLALVREVDILRTLADGLALPRLRNAATAVVITGPSRTGDIEMTHTVGVHGPKELHVFLIRSILD
jgi:L-lactate dehydrogenase complex protein LldF